MERKILFALPIFSLFCFSIVTQGVIIDPDIEFIVENETYVVQTSMDFDSITISETYIVFNTTGFHISSPNNIRITLVSLHGDITGADNGEKVLAFYAETSNGEVWFSLSGFPINNEYVVNRNGDPISYPTANNSGFITYSNSDWSIQLFEIIQTAAAPPNTPPVVADIPNQMIDQGENFAPIPLDDYVTDAEDSDENISWSYSGNSELIVAIVDRIATITVPGPEWEGQETVTFTAEDTGGLTDSDDATFTVIVQIIPPGGEEPPGGGAFRRRRADLCNPVRGLSHLFCPFPRTGLPGFLFYHRPCHVQYVHHYGPSLLTNGTDNTEVLGGNPYQGRLFHLRPIPGPDPVDA